MFARWILAVAVGLAISATTGVLAWALTPFDPVVSTIVFAAVALPFGVTLGWIVAVAPRTMPASPRSADSVETTWMTTALAGTATDLVLVAGLALAALAIARVEIPAQFVLLGILVVAFAATAARYAVARIRSVRA
jgi:hypothetical protein